MYEFDHPTPVTVVLRAQTGSVEIVAEERDTIQVDVQAISGGEAAAEAAANTRVTLEDDTLLIQAPGADYWTWRRSHKLKITARVPAGSALAGKSASADIRAIGVYSDVKLDVASADVELGDATGDVSLDAASGDLTTGRIGGSLRAKSSSGDLTIGDVTGDANVDTASGRIRTAAMAGSLRAVTASGDIEVGSLRQGRADIHTASGDIRVGIAPGSGVWMDVNTASGKSITDLTSHGDVPPADDQPSLELRVRTASGDVRIHRASHPHRAVA